jgi:hypothetical protein
MGDFYKKQLTIQQWLISNLLSVVRLFFPLLFLKISSAIALRPLCPHGSGLGPASWFVDQGWLLLSVGVLRSA